MVSCQMICQSIIQPNMGYNMVTTSNDNKQCIAIDWHTIVSHVRYFDYKIAPLS